MHLGYVGSPNIVHARLEATAQLIDQVRQATLVRNTSLDAFGNELEGTLLHIPVTRIASAALHGRKRTHAPVILVVLTLEDHDLTR